MNEDKYISYHFTTGRSKLRSTSRGNIIVIAAIHIFIKFITQEIISIYEAIRTGKASVVKSLINKDASVANTLEKHKAPLHVAATFGQLSILKYLLKIGKWDHGM